MPEDNQLKPLRTYESDLADALHSKNASATKIFVAEEEKKNSVEEVKVDTVKKSKSGGIILKIIFSMILITAGIGTAYYLYQNSALAPQERVVPEITIKRILPVDSQIQLASFHDDNISASDFVQTNDLNMPEILQRTLYSKWMGGVYNIDSKKIPFIIFQTDYFQNAYTGMIKWESTMPEDFKKIFNYGATSSINTEASSSTESALFKLNGKFVDKAIQNRDIREYINGEGENVVILYTFLDKETVIITTSEEIIPGIISKFEKRAYSR